MIGRGWPQPFGLVRDRDVSGISGTGVVASGVIWPDSRVAMLWTGATPPPGYPRPVRQVNLWDHVDEVEGVHGHLGHTRLDARDPSVPCVDLGLAVFGIVCWYRPRSRVTHWGARWDNGHAVTWRADPAKPPRVEHWPTGATAAFLELGDVEADEARLMWVPADALSIASAGRSAEGRRWLTPAAGNTAAKKSPWTR